MLTVWWVVEMECAINYVEKNATHEVGPSKVEGVNVCEKMNGTNG